MRMMPAPFRSLLALCLALVLALTSAHWAIGRAQAQGAAELVICADGSVTTVTLGADGKPVETHHSCPDCVLGGLALAAAAPPLAPAALGRARNAPPRPGRAVPPQPALGARARGPPGRG